MMSAVVYGKRTSSYFEDLQYNQSSLPPPSSAAKRIRCSSSSPTRFSPPRSSVATVGSADTLLGHLRSAFPGMEQELLEKVLKESGNDLDLAIKSLNEFCIGSITRSFSSSSVQHAEEINSNAHLTPEVANGEFVLEHLPVDGSEWVELLVREMRRASDMDDAKTRAAKVVELLENKIKAHANSEAYRNFEMESLILKEKVQGLLHDNNILKHAVAIQHERQKEMDERNQEIPQLKKLILQYQERAKTLEISNYTLTLHLKQAQQSRSIPGSFHPDVF